MRTHVLQVLPDTVSPLSESRRNYLDNLHKQIFSTKSSTIFSLQTDDYLCIPSFDLQP